MGAAPSTGGAPPRTGRRAAPAPAQAAEQGSQRARDRAADARVAEPTRPVPPSAPAGVGRDVRPGHVDPAELARVERPVRQSERPAPERPAPSPAGHPGADRQVAQREPRAAARPAAPQREPRAAEYPAPDPQHPGAERPTAAQRGHRGPERPAAERPAAERPAPGREHPAAARPVPQREHRGPERPASREHRAAEQPGAPRPPQLRPIAERPASMRPLHPEPPRIVPADVPRAADRSAPRRDVPRDLRADSTDDLSAVLSAAANTGRAPDGLEFREFDVVPPRDPRRSAPERASAGGRDDDTAEPATRPKRAPAGAPAPHAQRSVAPGSSTEAFASRPVSRRSLRNALTSRAASTVAMGFVALLAVATSVPSLSLLSPADVQAMALSETTVVTIDGQRVDITGDAAAAAIDQEAYQAQSIEEYARAAGIRPEATFTNNPLGTIQWPFAVGVHIGDRFGYRNCAGCSSNHRGQDFNPGDGAHIQSIADGVVSVSTDAGGSLGAVTMIDHVIDGQTVTSVYAHMQYGTRRFEVGDRVEVGDVVGNTGNTGMSTGPHLHFEIRLGGVGGTHVDPLEWLWANTN